MRWLQRPDTQISRLFFEYFFSSPLLENEHKNGKICWISYECRVLTIISYLFTYQRWYHIVLSRYRAGTAGHNTHIHNITYISLRYQDTHIYHLYLIYAVPLPNKVYLLEEAKII